MCSVTQSCPTLCNHMDCSHPGSFVRGSSQVRILEWIAISFSRGTSQPRDQTRVSCIAGGFFTTSATWEAQISCIIWWYLTYESESHSVVPNSLPLHGLYRSWNSSGQNTGVDSLSLLQGIFPTQGSNPGLPQCRWILYQLSHKGRPRILEWVAYSFSRGSS